MTLHEFSANESIDKPIQASVEIHVPFHDVDSARVVWHGHYFKYFEIARCELLESIGYNYTAMHDSGYFWPVVDSTVRFRRPAFYDQRIDVQATLVEWELRLVLDYLIKDKTGEVLVRGKTVQVPVDGTSWEMVFGCPQTLLDSVARYRENRLAE